MAADAVNDNDNNSSKTPPPPPPPSPTPLIMPVLHSRKCLPRACLDPAELQDLTEDVLSAPFGNLFQYPQYADGRRPGMSDAEWKQQDSRLAWNVADGTVQKVEYLLRGHSAKIPGTLWHQWTRADGSAPVSAVGNDDEDPLESLAVIDSLVARMWDEGSFFMETRQKRYSQLAMEEDLKESTSMGSAEDEFVAADWKKFAREDTISDDLEDDEDWKAPEPPQQDGVEQGSDEVAATHDMTEDFAMPGPSVDMYDIYLDAIATIAGLIPSKEAATPLVTAKHALYTHEFIMYRHQLDGGDAANTNQHTQPTQISYNAVIRAAANFPFDGGEDLESDEIYRDWAIMASMSVHDRLVHAKGIERNSSTYAYLLQVIAKYMPPCTYRGNVARGLWRLAKVNGVYNQQVQDALLLANAESNGPEHDEWLDENIRGKDWRTDAPHRWRRRVQKYRMVPHQTTY